MGNKQAVPTIENISKNIVNYFKEIDIKNCIKIKTIFDLVKLSDYSNTNFRSFSTLVEIKFSHRVKYYMLNEHSDNYYLADIHNQDMIIKNIIHLLQNQKMNQNMIQCITHHTKNDVLIGCKCYDISTKISEELSNKIANVVLTTIANQKNKEKCTRDKINEIENELIALDYYANKNLYDKCTRIKTNGTVVEYTKYIDLHMLNTEVFDILVDCERVKYILQNDNSSKIIQRLEILLWCLDYKPQCEGKNIDQYVEVLPSAPYIECTENLTIPVASAIDITQTYDNVCIAVAHPMEK